MSKAGVLAGLVTTNAPADGSPTIKRKGYHWFEYGGEALSGLCGTLADITAGLLLGPTPLQLIANPSNALSVSNVFSKGLVFSDTQVISFTFAFSRDNDPSDTAPIMQISGPSSEIIYDCYMDNNGHIKIQAFLLNGTTILDVTITNNGNSFTGAINHFIAGVVDLSDPIRREIWVDSIAVTDNTDWVTWVTYIDDIIPLEATSGDSRGYDFGRRSLPTGLDFGQSNGTGESGGVDALGFVTFDDVCSLITPSVWTGQWVKDPQRWEGWYTTQPQVFFGQSFWRNTGKTGRSSYDSDRIEKRYEQTGDDFYITPLEMTEVKDAVIVNLGIN